MLSTGLLLIATAAALTAVALSVTDVSGQIRWGAIALGVFCTGLLLVMAAVVGFGGLGLGAGRIGAWSLVWSSVAFGAATVSQLGPQTGPTAEILPESILRALWLIAVAMALFTCGYCAGPRGLSGTLARRTAGALTSRFTDDIRGPGVPWILFTIGIAAQLTLAVVSGHLGYVGAGYVTTSATPGYSQFLALLGQCIPLSVAAAAVRAYQTRLRTAWLTLAVLFTAAVIAGAVAGGKTSFVVAILAVLIPHAVIRRRFPVGLPVISIAVFLLVVIPFNQAYRVSARGAVTLSTGAAVASAPAIASKVLSSDLSPAVLGESARSLIERVSSIGSPAIIMQRTPGQIPYASPGELVVSPVLDLIPRILWPGKPVLDVGYQMSQEYFQLPPQEYTSSAITTEGDLYRHGGWVVLVVGMFLIGWGARVIDDIADLRRSIQGLFLIILVFPDLVQSASDCSTLLAGIPGTVLLWFGVVALSFNRFRRGRPWPEARASAMAARS